MDLRTFLALAQSATPPATLRVVAWGACCAAIVAGLWWHPASPIALWRGDVALGNGQWVSAAEAYDAVGRGHPSAAVRAEALRRSAAVWSVELAQPTEARLRYEALLQVQMEGPARADALAGLGQLLVAEGEYALAAQRLREAHDLDPQSVEASARLVGAARAAMMGREDPLAERIWRRLGSLHPVHAGRAHLGRGNLRLQRGDAVGALQHFEEAVHTAFDPSVTAAAQLGIATCLARLGDLEQALSELDRAELPDDIEQQRISSMKARDRLVQ